MPLLNFVLHAAALLLATARAFGDFLWLFIAHRGKITVEDRAHWLNRTCGVALRWMRVRVTVKGRVPESGLIVSNHLSYLDILVFSSIVPVLFVSKREVRSWPIFGLLAHMAGTRFLDRERSSDAHRVQNEVQDALASGSRVLIFPEGTSSNGTAVLPFKPALFEAAAGKHPVTAAHISYRAANGRIEQDVCYWGDMTFFPHLLKLLSKSPISVSVAFAEPFEFGDRKLAAIETHRLVCSLIYE